jgi:hypothetical protein
MYFIGLLLLCGAWSPIRRTAMRDFDQRLTPSGMLAFNHSQ